MTTADRVALRDQDPGVDEAASGLLGRIGEWLLVICFMLVPVLTAWASTTTIAGLPPIRLLAVALLGLVVLLRHRIGVLVQVLLVVTAVWLAWGLFLAQGGPGYKELLGVAVGMVTVITMSMAASSHRWLILLCRGWLLGMIVTGLPGFAELATGKHLPNYLSGSSAWVRRSSVDIASFMVNPNLFAYFLVVGMTVMVVGWQLETGRVMRILYFVTALLTPVLVLFTGSRLCLAAVALLFGWMMLRSKVLTWTVAAVAVLGAVAAVLGGYLPRIMAAITLAIHDLSSTSGQSRLHLYQNGFWMLLHSAGLGIGPAQFQTAVLAAPWPTYASIDPHSGFTEVFTGYGVLIGCVLLALVTAAVVQAVRGDWRLNPARRGGTPYLQSLLMQAVAVSLLMSPMLAMANSSFLKGTVVWAQMGSLAVWCQALMSPRRWHLRDGLRISAGPDGRLSRRYRLVRRAVSDRALPITHE
ncbi:Lipid A core - O-antigen ligase and related enzymes [Acidipropionibacterium jensenii]|uniref:Lipid A core - O-antigen ligase and related enzymes n=1 Tax=Acidipropionibacterium jensenii TaxID=1749 RepID=A0A3S4UXJ6_9ACTN|nr:O-antigen ligase family protein [Acidipropionibacterium jensenii]VEI03117.1 Lipid A core - O-antigen ligase and related enzymes [Acidipropionibacterium jensenii]